MMRLNKTRITSWMMMLVAIFILFWLWGSGIVHATEPSQEMQRYTTVHITAEVPEGYDKEIIVYFNTEEEEHPFVLTKMEEYKRTIMIFEGEYQMSAHRKNSTDFLCEIDDTCTVSGDEMEFRFTVLSTPQQVTEQEAQTILENNAQPISADIPGIESGKEVLQEFLEATDYIKENDYFLKTRSVKNEVTGKKQWLEFRTEEEWNNASGYDVMIYEDIFYHPYYSMMNNNFSSEEEFVENATDRVFRKVEGGEDYIAALEKVSRWQYRYYEATGTLYNFFAEEGEENVHFNQEEKNENGLTKEELKELESAREELLEGKDVKEVLGGESKEVPIVKFMKDHLLAVILLIISACAIAGITIYIKSKSKGADE